MTKAKVYHDGAVSGARRAVDAVMTVLLAALCIVWIYPVFLILINSLKAETAISTTSVFELPTAASFVGLGNYIYGITKLNFLSSFCYSLIITVTSVVLILLCCSMCGWYITRVPGIFSQAMYLLCVFSMVVPFQMVMFTMSKMANVLHMDNPLGIILIYLGFGAGLSTFLFVGFVKGIPIELEEAAMIDGCGPIRTFFLVVLPVLKPIAVTVAILNAMWIWNDYLLPYLLLGTDYKTIPIAVQYLRGGYGSVDMGVMMAMLVLAIIPIVIFYLFSQ